MKIRTSSILAAGLVLGGLAGSVSAADLPPSPAAPVVEQTQLQILKNENDALSARIRQLEAVRCIPADRLKLKKAQKLKEINESIRAQRRTTRDFEGFVKWMSANLVGYNSYIHAGSYAALFARMLPIPYAGQASVFTKFVAQFTVSLNQASVSLTNYLNSSWQYLVMTNAIDTSKELDEKAMAEAARFADQKMLRDMHEARQKLAAVSDLSSGALSFLESINSYISSTDEYWNKAKGVFRKNVDPHEKSFLSESIYNLKGQADLFNGRLKEFESLGEQETAAVKALAVYDDLAATAAPLAAVKGGQ